MKLELKHLVGYLPYGLKVQYKSTYNDCLKIRDLEIYNVSYSLLMQDKPILRPLSDLTKEEINMFSIDFKVMIKSKKKIDIKNYTTLNEAEWLFENHFDIHGLIPAGLAIDINTLQL